MMYVVRTTPVTDALALAELQYQLFLIQKTVQAGLSFVTYLLDCFG